MAGRAPSTVKRSRIERPHHVDTLALEQLFRRWIGDLHVAVHVEEQEPVPEDTRGALELRDDVVEMLLQLLGDFLGDIGGRHGGVDEELLALGKLDRLFGLFETI